VLEYALAHGRRNVAVFAQRRHAVLFQLVQDGGQGVAAHVVVGQTGVAISSKKLRVAAMAASMRYSSLPSCRFQTRSAYCNSLARLLSRCMCSSEGSTTARLWPWSRPCLAVSSWPIIWGGPVLRHAQADQGVQRHGGRPHNVGAHCIVLGPLKRSWTIFNQRQQQTFGKAVLHLGADRIGQVLFDRMDKGIDYAVADLTRRQRIRRFWVQYGKAW